MTGQIKEANMSLGAEKFVERGPTAGILRESVEQRELSALAGRADINEGKVLSHKVSVRRIRS